MEKILTKHPQNKREVNISKERYNIIRKEILLCLKNKELTFSQIVNCLKKELRNFKDSIPWYVETLKLDLESRKIIKKIPKTQLYKLK